LDRRLGGLQSRSGRGVEEKRGKQTALITFTVTLIKLRASKYSWHMGTVKKKLKYTKGIVPK
jgi:hypothetical protein